LTALLFASTRNTCCVTSESLLLTLRLLEERRVMTVYVTIK
jgi:hypothetical protein